MKGHAKFGARMRRVGIMLAIAAGLLVTGIAAPALSVKQAMAAARPRYEALFSLSGGWQANGATLSSDAAGVSEAWLKDGSYKDATVKLSVNMKSRASGTAKLAVAARAAGSEGYFANLPVGGSPALSKGAETLATAADHRIASGTTYAVEFTQVGENLVVKIDGETVLTTQDAALAKGKIGLIATDADVTVTSFQVTAADPYRDYEFQKVTGDDLSGLEISGGWQNRDDKLKLTQAGGSNLIYLKGSEGFVDGTLSANVKFTGARAGDYAAFGFITRQENVGDHQKSNEINVEFHNGAFTGMHVRSWNFANNTFYTGQAVDAAGFEAKYGAPFDMNREYAVEIEMVGNTAKVSFDGHEILSASGLLYPSGKVGFESFFVDAELDNVTLTPAATNAAAQYQSDFTTKPEFLGADADVIAEDGVLKYPTTPSTGDKILWVTDSVEYQDAVIDFDVTFKTLGAGSEFSVFTRHNGDSWQKANHVKFAPGSAEICRMLDTYQVYQHADIANELNKPYHIRIENIGSAMRVYRDSVLILEANDTYYGHGEIGFNMWQGQVELDNLTIRTSKTVYDSADALEYRGTTAEELGWKYDAANKRLTAKAGKDTDRMVWLNGANNMKNLQVEFDMSVDGITPETGYSCLKVELRSNGQGQQSNHVKFETQSGNIVFGRQDGANYATYGVLKYAYPASGSVKVKIVMIGRFAEVWCNDAYIGRSTAYPETDLGMHTAFDVWNTDVTLDNVKISQTSESYDFAVSKTDTIAESTLRMNGGWTYGDGKLYLGSTEGNNAAYVNGTEDWTGGAVSFRLKLTDPNGPDGSIFNVAFGVPNTTVVDDFQDGNVMSFEQSPHGLNVKIYNGKGASPAVYAMLEGAASFDRDYEVKIVNAGDVMTLFLDGVAVATTERMNAKTGSIAFIGFNIGAEIRDLEVSHAALDLGFAATSISVRLPEETDYIEGQSLELGDYITANFADGYESVLDPALVTVTPAKLSVGTNSVQVALKSNPTVKTTVTVEARAKSATAFSITTPPTKVDYVTGEAIDLAGIRYSVTYDNGETVTDASDLSKLTAEADLSGAASGVTVTVKFGALSDTYSVDVVKKDVTAISVKTQPSKTEYVVGTNLDLAGLVIEATYNDGTKGNLASEAYTVDTTKLGTVGDAVTVSVALKADASVTAMFTVRVVAAKIVSIAIKSEPDKTVYTAGDSFDAKGLVVEATYDNGEKKVLAASEYDVSADLSVKNLDAVVTVTLKSDATKTATFRVIVNAKQSGSCNSALDAGAGFAAAGLLLAAGALILAKRKYKNG